MRCPRCGTEAVDPAGYCAGCRLYRGQNPAAAQPAPPVQPPAAAQPAQPPAAGQPLPPGQRPAAAQPAPPVQPPAAAQPPAAGQPLPPGQPPAAAQPPVAGQPLPPGQRPAAAQWVPPAVPPAQPPAVPQPVPPAQPQAVPQPAPAGFYPPPAPPRSRNPLLIPGIIFGVVALLLVGGVIVYALTGGDKPEDQGLTGGTNPVVAASAPPTSDEPSPAPTDPIGGLPGPSASDNATPSPTAVPCILGVFLEEQHTEQVTVLNTGTFTFTGSGAYHRYNESGRVVIDYGDGMHLHGSNGATQFEYVFEGFISYQFKYDGSTVTFSSPRPDGTETFIRDGHVDYKGKLEPRVPQPMKVNCGPVAMSLSNPIYTLQLKRTSKAP